MNEEIFAGLRNAVEKGFSLEEAVQSFINAGYNPSEVREASSFLSRGIPALPTVAREAKAETEAEAVVPSIQETKKKASKTVIWIILILIALIVIAIAMSVLLFKDKFLKVIDAILP